jgi:hypothetical protein
VFTRSAPATVTIRSWSSKAVTDASGSALSSSDVKAFRSGSIKLLLHPWGIPVTAGRVVGESIASGGQPSHLDFTRGVDEHPRQRGKEQFVGGSRDYEVFDLGAGGGANPVDTKYIDDVLKELLSR